MTRIHAGSRTVRMPERPRESLWPTLGPPLEPPYELSDDLPERILLGARGTRLRNLHPYRMQNRYNRAVAPRLIRTIVIENDRLRAEFLPELGGRLWSLRDLERGVELLHSPDEIVFANVALRNAWFAGGIEFNIGTRGHAAHTCEDVHAGLVVAADGTESLRLWGYERVHGLVFQIDVSLPPEAAALVVKVRVRNPNHEVRPLYWWSNAAVPQEPRTRVLSLDRRAFATDYDGGITSTEIDSHHGVDCSWPDRCPHASDFFIDGAGAGEPWITAVDEWGDGLLMASDDALPGRKLFCWGSTGGSRWWQDRLTPSGARYAEIQAGVTTTQFEARELPAHAAYEWTEIYGNSRLGPQDPDAEWARASTTAGVAVQVAVREARAADAFGDAVRELPVGSVLHAGTGWGALAALLEPDVSDDRTPFPASDLERAQDAWAFIAAGSAPPEHVRARAGDVSGRSWETALDAVLANEEDAWLLARAGGIRHARGDLEAAETAYRRSLERASDPAAHRGLGLLLEERGGDGTEHLRLAAESEPSDPEVVGEFVSALIAKGRHGDARAAIESFPSTGTDPRIRVLLVRALLAGGEPADLIAARHELERGIDVVDLREGEVIFPALWSQVSNDPLPWRYDTQLA